MKSNGIKVLLAVCCLLISTSSCAFVDYSTLLNLSEHFPQLKRGTINPDRCISGPLFTCSEDGQYVTNLLLSSLGLTGTFPIEITKLSHLEGLFLDNNSISGKLPDEIGQLKQLQHFNLSHNSFISGIPYSIGDMTSLQEVDFSYNRFWSTLHPAFGRLTELRVLRVNSNRITRMTDTLAKLENLVELDISCTLASICDFTPRQMFEAGKCIADKYDYDEDGECADAWLAQGCTLKPAESSPDRSPLCNWEWSAPELNERS